MKVGVFVTSYNTADWDRLLEGDYSRGPRVPDVEILDNTISFGAMVEPLGFDSIWTTEHWGSPYAMQADPLQWLAYWAARTERVDLGTAVLVLPWWDPVRLAHEMALLDILLDGRRFIPGVGRGIAPHEYASFRIPPSDSRERFYEVLDVLRLADSEEAFEYDGTYYKIPLTTIRPQPRHKGHLLDGVRGAFTTPKSAELAAANGVGQMFVAGETPAMMAERAALFNKIREQNGYEPSSTTAMLFTRCVPSMDDPEDAAQYFIAQLSDAVNHYGIWKNPGFEGVKGYEDYAADSKPGAALAGAAKTDKKTYAAEREGAQLIGTPDEIIQKIADIKDAIGMDQLVIHINHGGIPIEEAKASLELFAAEVLPVVQEMEPGAPRTEQAVPTSQA